MSARDMVLLPAEARARGFRNALAFRRWCARWGVPIYREESGRMHWVRPAEVDEGARRATGTEAPQATADDETAVRVARAVAQLQGR